VSTPHDPRAQAIARGRAYDLLGGLFRRGPQRLDHLRAIDALAPFVPETIDDDVLAEHYRLLGQELPPHESVFLEPTALLGGGRSRDVRQSMAQGGFSPDDSDAEPDHLGTELAFLAHLCGAEADAWRDGEERVARRIQSLQREFLGLHLLPWLPPLVVALDQVDRGEGRGLYAAAARLTLELAVDHHGAPLPEVALPPLAPILDQPKTGMRQIGDFLAVPANLGALPTPSWIRAVGRRAGVSSGFGKRGMLLESLLQTAVRRGELGVLLGVLDEELAALQEATAALPLGGAWAARLGESRGLVGRMAGALAAGS
jgi:hypothetical protein